MTVGVILTSCISQVKIPFDGFCPARECQILIGSGCILINGEIIVTPIFSRGVHHCEVIVYRHTVTRPGYCPFCLWNKNLAAEDRLYQWLRSNNLKKHIEDEHMLGEQKHGARPRGLRHHLHDTHRLNKAIWFKSKTSEETKTYLKARISSSISEIEEKTLKKFCFYRYPPPRHEYKRASFCPP
ncbi:hypothetical protein N7532_000709 [Penicillium argentinense]|uniref:Uncharacterized protein n=1 Tax=Penicillium argentinense TaxID=1131581 RepID=A0A9W9KMV7_9EURO|nr:uncharacterized protein N7532_000709 [Penicillium argentinense]KAJ5112664.1 hypothetical protein N7532_000709 [Penicillium argentinense]